ncbi:hypothetical protein EV191_11727 [Tamaricihabitans halophyticus]|uniref:Uncharacterized protein n=1 Tax=Tamaricihabitans halophyticus TaxID=1262583 RepID=A0A4R2QDI8_9PSEU|nr:hypothetical protein [Tamaricihabitans halophyticus]TCP45061.1 hypothetical protein EV191_11727 [Tamaricihabitans halophyticus]
MSPIPTLQVSLRETRLVTERIVMLLGVAKGSWAAVREAVVAAEAIGLGGLRFLDRCEPGCWGTPALTKEDGAALTVTANGIPAPFAAPALVDLALATSGEYGRAELTVHGLRDAELLPVMEPLGGRLGANIQVRATPEGQRVHASQATNTVHPDSLAAMAGGQHLRKPAIHGLTVPAELWWRLYHRSNEALTADTPLSRNHAGAALLTDGAGLTETDPDYVAEAAH